MSDLSAPAGTAVITIVAKNYLAHARVLMDSVAHSDPSFLRFVLLVDQPEGYFDPANEDFEVVLSDDIAIPNSRWFHFKYSVLELSTAVKPYFISWLFKTYDLAKIIYLDPDIRVFESLAGITQLLDESQIILTPHLTDVLNDDRQPSELHILRCGVYNLGFIALRRTAEVDKFLLWWQAHLYSQCVVDLSSGLFVDQRWVDMVPGAFSNVFILREAGYNVAYWNLSHRILSHENERILVNGQALYFFHFSGYNPARPDVLSKHQDRVSLDTREDVRVVCDRYREKLLLRGVAEISRWPYTHARFYNGCAIPDAGRLLFNEAPHLMDDVKDPFSDEGYERMLTLWNAPVSRTLHRHSGITRLAYRIYRSREDVRVAMPDIFGADHQRFLEWVITSGPQEHSVSEPLLAEIREALRSQALHNGDSDRQAQDERLPALCADLLENGAGNSIFTRIMNGGTANLPEALNVRHGESHLTVLAQYVYESRPDLQRAFPEVAGKDEVRYLIWFLTSGRDDYSLSEEYLVPIRQRLHKVRAELPVIERLRLDIRRGMFAAARQARPLAAAVQKTRRNRIAPAPVARPKTAPPAQEAPRRLTPLPNGVNVYGYFRAEMGVGQSARNGIEAMKAAGIPFSVHNLSSIAHSELDLSVSEFASSAEYGVNVSFVNADQTTVVRDRIDRSGGKYNVAFWTWELEHWPREWDAAYPAYDEVWVPSSFCQATISARSPVPVIRIPYCVRLPETSGKTRRDFGIDPDRFVFLTVFDIHSCFDRKNPVAAMRAFRAAFDKGSPCELIVKVNHANASPERLQYLREQAARYSVRLIEETFRHEDVAALIAASDCVVSLHRSEGFGLVMGEAMLMEKAVLATAYSGNMDFTTPDTAFLVPYEMRSVGSGNAPYPKDALWADPSVEEAARQMAEIYQNPALRLERAQAGRRLIEGSFSPTAVGAAMAARLQAIREKKE